MFTENLKTMAAVSLIVTVSCNTASAGQETDAVKRDAVFGDLAVDEAIQSSAIDVSQCIRMFQATPNSGSLQAVHLACRDLKSQLHRYRSYFGATAVRELKNSLLPLLDSVLATVTAHQKDSRLGASKVTLTLLAIESCRQSLHAVRNR